MQRGRNLIANPNKGNLLGLGVISDKAPHNPLPLSKFPKAIWSVWLLHFTKTSFAAAQKHHSASRTKVMKLLRGPTGRSDRKGAEPDLLMLHLSTKTSPCLGIHSAVPAPGAGEWSESPAAFSAQSLWQIAQEEQQQAYAQWNFIWESKVLKEIRPAQAEEKQNHKLSFILSELAPSVLCQWPHKVSQSSVSQVYLSFIP